MQKSLTAASQINLPEDRLVHSNLLAWLYNHLHVAFIVSLPQCLGREAGRDSYPMGDTHWLGKNKKYKSKNERCLYLMITFLKNNLHKRLYQWKTTLFRYYQNSVLNILVDKNTNTIHLRGIW